MKHKIRPLAGLLALAFILPPLSFALQLEGGVEHTAVLPELSPALAPGNSANPQALQAEAEMNVLRLRRLAPIGNPPLQGQVDQNGNPLQGQVDQYGNPLQGKVDQYGRPLQAEVDQNGRPFQGLAEQMGRAPLQGQANQNGPFSGQALQGDSVRNPLQGQASQQRSPLTAACDSTMLRQQMGNRWVMIPKWMAGVWHRDRQINITVNDFNNKFIPARSGSYASESTMSWGQQVDAQGNIWHYLDSNSMVPSGHGTRVDFLHHLLLSDARLINGDLEFIRQFNVRAQLGHNGRISQTQRQEEIQYIWPINRDTLEVVCSTQVYNDRGRPTLKHTSGWYLRRVKDFQVQDRFRGVPLKDSLRTFLQVNNMYGLQQP
jgi:hypothetical protein